jgi:hypothetical protein
VRPIVELRHAGWYRSLPMPLYIMMALFALVV